jgi:hypothetical protein
MDTLKKSVNAAGFESYHVNVEFTPAGIQARADTPARADCGAAATNILYHIHLSFLYRFMQL